jgi:hypothetical protein
VRSQRVSNSRSGRIGGWSKEALRGRSIRMAGVVGFRTTRDLLYAWNPARMLNRFSVGYLDFGPPDSSHLIEFMERETGLEPARPAWEAGICEGVHMSRSPVLRPGDPPTQLPTHSARRRELSLTNSWQVAEIAWRRQF